MLCCWGDKIQTLITCWSMCHCLINSLCFVLFRSYEWLCGLSGMLVFTCLWFVCVICSIRPTQGIIHNTITCSDLFQPYPCNMKNNNKQKAHAVHNITCSESFGVIFIQNEKHKFKVPCSSQKHKNLFWIIVLISEKWISAQAHRISAQAPRISAQAPRISAQGPRISAQAIPNAQKTKKRFRELFGPK